MGGWRCFFFVQTFVRNTQVGNLEERRHERIGDIDRRRRVYAELILCVGVMLFDHTRATTAPTPKRRKKRKVLVIIGGLGDGKQRRVCLCLGRPWPMS